MDENTQNKSGQQGGDANNNGGGEGEDLDTRISKLLDAKLNSALTARDKRLQAALVKTLEEKLTQKTPEAAGGGNASGDTTGNAGQAREGAHGGGLGREGAQRADPEVVKLKEKLDQLERKNLESEARAKAVEEKARHDGMRAQVREALEAKGITGLRAASLIALFSEQKQLQFNEETGEPEIIVTRARAKGARPEPLAFSIKEGIEDWAKGEEANAFKPAAQIQPPGGPRRPLTTGARTSGPDGVPSDDALAELFRKQGIDLNNV